MKAVQQWLRPNPLRFSRSYTDPPKWKARVRTFAVLRDQPPVNDDLQRLIYQQKSQITIADIRDRISKSPMMSSVTLIDLLRRHYPDCTVTHTPASLFNLVRAGEATAVRDKVSDIYASRVFERPGDEEASNNSRLAHYVKLGHYDYHWKGHSFQVFVVRHGISAEETTVNRYIVYPQSKHDLVDGQSKAVDSLIEASAKHGTEVTEQIWVYDRGSWRKNRKLWDNVQAAIWENVILDEKVKKSLRSDVEAFFDEKDAYKGFSVPWKRGLIFHGLPGNGKTITIKALMRTLSQRNPSIPTLYVKSLGKCGDQDNIRDIFTEARHSSPCLLVLEDIDSMIKEDFKSFFLNEVDGLEGNDGIMLIASTNYLDKLDAGISKRPSRFDRKYHFSLPANSERKQYCEYWRTKLQTSNPDLSLPEDFSAVVANVTEGFSFAYLQEMFVSALLSLVRLASSKPDISRPNVEDPAETMPKQFSSAQEPDASPVMQAIKKQVEVIRKEMKDSRKSVEDAERNSITSDPRTASGSSTGFGLGR